jgi:hypothetical protein
LYWTLSDLFNQILAQGFVPGEDESEEDNEVSLTLRPPEYAPGEFPTRAKILAWMVGDNMPPVDVAPKAAAGLVPRFKGVDTKIALDALKQRSSAAWADIVEEEETQKTLAPPPAAVAKVVQKADAVAARKPVALAQATRVPPDVERREQKRVAYNAKVAELQAMRRAYRDEPMTKKASAILRGKGKKQLQALKEQIEEGDDLARTLYEEQEAEFEHWDDEPEQEDEYSDTGIESRSRIEIPRASEEPSEDRAVRSERERGRLERIEAKMRGL